MKMNSILWTIFLTTGSCAFSMIAICLFIFLICCIIEAFKK